MAKEISQDDKKPYSVAEIREHKANGTIIGAPSQKLSSGHSEESNLQWEEWQMEYFMKLVQVPEVNALSATSVPFEAYAVKKLKSNVRSAAITIQALNKQRQFNLIAAPNYHSIYFPAGAIEAGKKYPITMWVEVVGRGTANEKALLRAWGNIPEVTGYKEGSKTY